MLRAKAPTKRQTPLRIEGCEGGQCSYLGFSRTHWSSSTSSQSICSDGGFCSHPPVCVWLCQSPFPGPPISSQEELRLFPSSKVMQELFPAAGFCSPLLAGNTNQHPIALPLLAAPGLSLTVQQLLEQWECRCRLLASVVLLC